MASASSSLSGLPLEQLALYHAVDPLLQSSIFVFYGPVTTANSTVSSSRIQAHIISLAGVESYPRITVSPVAPLYAAVHRLPREKQGDEVYRGLAVCLLKYFSEISDTVKDGLTMLSRSGKQAAKSTPTQPMFDETHAAEVANKMVKVEDSAVAAEVVLDLKSAFGDRIVPWIDIDFTLPPGSISSPRDCPRESAILDGESAERFADRFGAYSPFIDALGEPIFLPTSKLKRAPSQPTNLSKSKIFSASQKESLRLAMCEMVDTEERYVGKMYDLVHNVAQQFRQKAQDKSVSSTSPNETELSRLFPPCLSEILDVNMGFLDALRQILEETEKEALSDIPNDTPLDSTTFPRDPVSGRRQDSLGIIAFAQCLVDWLPQFSQPYAQYMQAHTSFSKVLNDFLGNQDSSFSKRVQESGEQRMRSLLMEPVQRLPRYSLLIDTITSALPSVHPAVRPLLKARDTITEICSLDAASNSQSQTVKQLQNLVSEWPSSLTPQGRLITTADVSILPVPYRIGKSHHPGIFLVYSDFLVLLSKSSSSKLTARGLLADLDKPQPVEPSHDGNTTSPELMYSHAIPLEKVRVSQSKCGRVIYLLPAENLVQQERFRSRSALRALELGPPYDGRAGKLIEEITKAKIQGRFPDHFRESGKYSLHNPGGILGDTMALVSVYEDGTDAGPVEPKTPATVKVIFDAQNSTLSKYPGVEVLVSISKVGPEKYKLALESVVRTSSTDTVSATDFVSTLSKRLHNLLRPLNQPQNPILTDSIVLSNFNILRVIAEQVLGPVKSSRSFRPPSPTKFLSNFWGGNQVKDQQSSAKQLLPSSATTNVPKIPPPTINYPEKDSPEKTTDAAAGGINIADETSGQLKQLERTFMAYILAIQSRRGNIVGRVLRSRDKADPSAVNELYNILLEDSSRLQAAAETSVDVLIVAFETFMARAWKDKMGPLIPASTLQVIQSKFDSMFPRDFENYFRRFLSEMSPQTRRALTALVKLLAELLEASGNDGDRGALTAVFSEVLTEESNPREYISLIDRLVEDFDRLFDDSTGSPGLPGTGSADDRESTPTRPRPQTATSSVNSNTSSFRKRFGLGGLSRERSKTESEGKFNSLIRSLSKAKATGPESDSQNNMLDLPKDMILRSKSTDTDTRTPPVLRPISRDRPLIQSLFSSMEDSQRPDSSHSTTSSHASAGEGSSGRKSASPKKKRRSSLSDLPPVPAAEVRPLFSGKEARRPGTPGGNSDSSQSRSRPGTADRSSPTKLGPAIEFNRESPSRATPPPPVSSPTARPTAPTHKENIPPSPRNTLGERAINRRSNPPVGNPHSARKRGDSVSQPPSAKSPVRKEKQLNGAEPLVSRTNSVPSSPTKTSPTKGSKLRMQNPQKLRERIQNEQKALASAESSLQDELTSIGNEISNPKGSPSKTRPFSSGANVKFMASPPGSSASSSTPALMNRIRSLEEKVTTLTSTFGSRTSSLEKDIEDSLLVSERRSKKLDELYRETSAENQALYERFNNELSRVTKEARMGNGEEAVRSQLKEVLEEVARAKKENLRLKREVVGLRAQQSGSGEPGKYNGA